MSIVCVWIPAFRLDRERDAAVWHAVLEALDAASPLVEDAGWGRAFLEMHGIDGGAEGWIGAVRGALTGFDLPLRLALGPNPFVARAAAVAGDGTICDGDPAAFVAPFSLELLDCETTSAPAAAARRSDDARGARRAAARTVRPPLRPPAARWHEHARGIDRRPLRPRAAALRIDRHLYGEGEATSEEAVLFALRTLVGRVVDDLGAAGKRAGRLVLALECENGDVRELTTRVAQPTAVPGRCSSCCARGSRGHARRPGRRPAARRRRSRRRRRPDRALRSRRPRPGRPRRRPGAARCGARRGPCAAPPDRRGAARSSGVTRTTRSPSSRWSPPAGRRPRPPRYRRRRRCNCVRSSRSRSPSASSAGCRDSSERPRRRSLEAAGPWRVDEGWWAGATGAGETLDARRIRRAARRRFARAHRARTGAVEHPRNLRLVPSLRRLRLRPLTYDGGRENMNCHTARSFVLFCRSIAHFRKTNDHLHLR